jgi:hypothetical protein
MEDMMKTLTLLAGLAAAIVATGAAAHDTTVAYSTRGGCEASSAAQSNAEKDWLLDTFPQFFSTEGDVSSFLTRAFTCDRNGSDGQFYMTDHIADTLASDWFQQRNR